MRRPRCLDPTAGCIAHALPDTHNLLRRQLNKKDPSKSVRRRCKVAIGIYHNRSNISWRIQNGNTSADLTDRPISKARQNIGGIGIIITKSIVFGCLNILTASASILPSTQSPRNSSNRGTKYSSGDSNNRPRHEPEPSILQLLLFVRLLVNNATRKERRWRFVGRMELYCAPSCAAKGDGLAEIVLVIFTASSSCANFFARIVNIHG